MFKLAAGGSGVTKWLKSTIENIEMKNIGEIHKGAQNQIYDWWNCGKESNEKTMMEGNEFRDQNKDGPN